jgi:hypothetical protein
VIDKDIRAPVRNHFNFFLLQIVSILITGIFLALWAAIQYGVNYLINLLQPTGVDQVILLIFQGVFGVTTLIPIVMYYYIDTRVSWIRAKRRIGKELVT